MRKLALILMAAMVVAFISCTDGVIDNIDSNTNGSIVGKWEAVADYDFVNGSWVLDYTYDPKEFALQFTSDGKVNQYDYGTKTLTATYSYNAPKRELTIMGMIVEVESLTSSELMIITKSLDAYHITNKTIYKRIQ